MNYGKVEEPSSSRNRYPSTARYAATSAILTVTLSRSDKARMLPTVNARPGYAGRVMGLAQLEAVVRSLLAAACVVLRRISTRSTMIEQENTDAFHRCSLVSLFRLTK